MIKQLLIRHYDDLFFVAIVTISSGPIYYTCYKEWQLHYKKKELEYKQFELEMGKNNIFNKKN